MLLLNISFLFHGRVGKKSVFFRINQIVSLKLDVFDSIDLFDFFQHSRQS